VFILGFFESLINPSWGMISVLPDLLRKDVTSILILPGFLRSQVRTQLLHLFQKFLIEDGNRFINGPGADRTGITQSLDNLLCDEAVIAILKCQSSARIERYLHIIEASLVPHAIGSLIASGLNDTYWLAHSRKYFDLTYSTDRGESIAQLIDVWRQILQINDVRIIPAATEILTPAWEDCCEHMLAGGLSGINRLSDKQRSSTAKRICKGLTKSQQGVVKNFISHALKNESLPNRRPPTQITLKGADGSPRVRVNWNSAGQSSIEFVGSENQAVSIMMGMAAVFLNDISSDDWSLFCNWCGLSKAFRTEVHYEEFVVGYVNWLAKMHTQYQAKIEFLAESAKLCALDENIPVERRPLSKELSEVYLSLFKPKGM
jgi:hypothetical protein